LRDRVKCVPVLEMASSNQGNARRLSHENDYNDADWDDDSDHDNHPYETADH
jgi:hypothetical protein